MLFDDEDRGRGCCASYAVALVVALTVAIAVWSWLSSQGVTPWLGDRSMLPPTS